MAHMLHGTKTQNFRLKCLIEGCRLLFDFIFLWIFASIVGNEIILILETLVVCLGYVCNKNDLHSSG